MELVYGGARANKTPNALRAHSGRPKTSTVRSTSSAFTAMPRQLASSWHAALPRH